MPRPSTPVPPLSGVHHVKIPVTDLDRSRRWYETVVGYHVSLEFPEADGTVLGVAGEVPGLGSTGLALRLTSDVT